MLPGNVIGNKPMFSLLLNHFGNGDTHNVRFVKVIFVMGTPSEGPEVRALKKPSSELSPILSPLSTGVNTHNRAK